MGFVLPLLLAFIATLVAFVGVYRDREHLDYHLFLKHRPALQWNFWSPVGESDMRAVDLTPAEQSAEKLYKKFVEEGGGYRRSFPTFLR